VISIPEERRSQKQSRFYVHASWYIVQEAQLLASATAKNGGQFVSCLLRPLYPWANSPGYLTDKRLSGAQCQARPAPAGDEVKIEQWERYVQVTLPVLNITFSCVYNVDHITAGPLQTSDRVAWMRERFFRKLLIQTQAMYWCYWQDLTPWLKYMSGSLLTGATMACVTWFKNAKKTFHITGILDEDSTLVKISCVLIQLLKLQ
jgi:hypothetical protein